jgi:hypothetical protein
MWEERNAIYDALHPRIGAWAAIWWGVNSVQAAALGHPWQTVQYGARLVQDLNAVLRPYRYTMRRKMRRMLARD